MMKAGADGLVEVGTIIDGSCCPPDLCEIDVCGLICNFVKLLPSGPLWDVPKQAALDHYQSADCTDESFVPDILSGCMSIVVHSVYAGHKLRTMLSEILWPAIRESDPTTAFDQMESWIMRLGWKDCYEGACRDPDLGPRTPYEIQTQCGNLFCEVDMPDVIRWAYLHALIQALVRLRMGIIKNLASINWVIEPLGAKLLPGPGASATACPLQFTLAPISSTLPGWTRLSCPAMEDELAIIRSQVPGSFVPGPCNGVSRSGPIWPGLMSAECIVRSILPRNRSYRLTRNF
jgi:hypothetical protein